MADAERLQTLIQENVEINTLLQRQAEAGLTGLHRPIEQIGATVGKPVFIFGALVVFALWIILNLNLKFFTHKPWDEPPFYWLQGVMGFLSLLVTTTVLVAQARQSQLAEQRAQLQLQISLLAEQRTAKIIGLLEELRRDLPSVHDRVDEQAEIMQQSTDPEAIVEALATLEQGGPTSLPPQG